MKFILLSCCCLLIGMFSCGGGVEGNPDSGVLPGDVAISSCYSMQPDFTFNYQNMSGFSKSTIGGKSYLTNLSSKVVYTFEAETGLLANKRTIVKDGPLGIGGTSSFDGVFYLGGDSTLYSSNAQNKIFLITPDKVETVVDFSKVDGVRLTNSFRNPPVEGKDHILFSMYPNTKEVIGKGFAFVAVAKDLSSYDQVIDFAPAYDGKFFGTTPYFYWPSVAYNSKTESYVASFPIDHRLFEYDADFNLVETHEVQQGFIGEIEQFPYALDGEGNPDREDDGAYLRETSYFCNIYHSSESDLYFRLGTLAYPEDVRRELCVFIYDATFSKTKAYKLSSDYPESSIFALDEGLYLMNEAKLTTERSTELPYDCLTFEVE